MGLEIEILTEIAAYYRTVDAYAGQAVVIRAVEPEEEVRGRENVDATNRGTKIEEMMAWIMSFHCPNISS